MPLFPSTSIPDQKLVRALVDAGDELAFRQLYRRHNPTLMRLLRSACADEAAVEDATQDTWFIAVQRAGSFRWESSFRTWLLGIGLNIARATLRRQLRAAEDPIEAAQLLGSTAQEPAIDLERAVDALADGQREVFLLHDVEGLRHDEIALRLGVAPGTSRSQLHHARVALRNLLDHGEAQ